ncbi:MAG: hypothetical protein ABIQ90_01240 [Polaromonas sp.]
MHSAIDGETLLALWEGALALPAAARGDALLQTAAPDAAPACSLGERNARLAGLHTRLFGRELELLSHCPACGTVAQFSGDCETLAAQMMPKVGNAPHHRLEAYGHVIEFRLPDSADIGDIAIASGNQGTEDFTQRLLDRCVLGCSYEGNNVTARQLPARVLDALSQRIETLDPGASMSFALECPQCATHWQAPLDLGEVLWHKVRAAAEQVLLDIDALARAYGWTEREVLRLKPLRRAAYLQMVAS